MSKRYRRYRRNQGGSPLGMVYLLLVFGVFLIKEYWPALLFIGILASLVGLVVLFYRRKASRSVDTNTTAPLFPETTEILAKDAVNTIYSTKASIMTDREKAFFNVFRNILGSEYIIQPQINLASVIKKESQSRYQSELFRNIDFGVFDKNYTLKILIEINDETHSQQNRIERDKKVRSICSEAGIPLITFWTKYGINESYIRKRLSEHIPLSDTGTNTKLD